jgi:hypothetical protein
MSSFLQLKHGQCPVNRALASLFICHIPMLQGHRSFACLPIMNENSGGATRGKAVNLFAFFIIIDIGALLQKFFRISYLANKDL